MSEPTVYIVDDDPDMRDSLRWLLRTVGLRAVTYATAEEFARAPGADGPACLVLDVRMPGTGGLDLFERLAARGLRMPVGLGIAYGQNQRSAVSVGSDVRFVREKARSGS